MRRSTRYLTTAAFAGAIAAAGVGVAGTASATPPPPSPLCSLYSYPAMILIELTGGQARPLLGPLTSIQPTFCS
ncbi:hypothetical protein [Nocardia neocaledoniensis]|uniref:hypothetical protein n=1 Tax=Nocardia neocaledoniensis TaxID=236511 RepID=UPI002457AE87|nr:hypothetical protein [Nocardia neocaledoniensis]